MKNIYFALLFAAFFAMSCAHHRDVRPGDGGVNRVVVQTDDTEAGARSAIKQANHFCKEQGQSAVFVNEESKYTGDLDESTYKNAQRASKVGQAVGIGGGVISRVLGDGYTVEMKFKCK